MHHEQASQTSITTAYIRDPCTTGVFQTFRNGLDVVRMEAVLHPVTGTFVVLWSDIKVCFPGLTRLQNKDIYVPLIRGPSAYRVVPLGIQHQPGAIIDVIYDSTAPKLVKIRCNKKHLEHEPSKPVSSAAVTAVDPTPVVARPVDPSLLPATAPVRLHVIKSAPLEDTIRANDLTAKTTGLSTSRVHPQLQPVHNSPDSELSAKIISMPAYAALPAANLNSDSDSSEEDYIPSSFHSKTPPKEIDPAIIKMFVNAVNSSAAANRNLNAHLTDFGNRLQKSNPPLPDDIHSFRPRRDQFPRPAVLQFMDEVVLPTASVAALGTVKENSLVIPQPSTANLDSKVGSTFSVQSATLNISADCGSGSCGGSASHSRISTQIKKRKGRALRRSKEFQNAEKDPASIQLMSTLGMQQSVLPDNTFRDETTVKSSFPSSASSNSSYTTSSSNSSPANSSSSFTIHDMVTRRARDIMAVRYDWLDSPCSRLFVILPRKDNIRSVAEVKAMAWQDFDVHFLCDCIDIPGAGVDVNGLFKGSDRDGTGAFIPQSLISEDGVEIEPIRYTGHSYIPHLDLGESADLSLQKDCSALAPYLMAVLEMLEYGIVIDGKTKMMPLRDLEERKKVMYSIAFLVEHGVESSYQLYAKRPSSLQDIEPTPPLKPSQLFDFYHHRISVEEPLGTRIPFRTPGGDVRWVCSTHWNQLTVWDQISRAFDFSKNLDSAQSIFHMNIGAFVLTLKTRERARELYELVGLMKSTVVVSFFLDWHLTTEDARELETVPSRLHASCVKIQVRESEDHYDGSVLHSGFGHGYFKVVLEALKNKQIEAFMIEKRVTADTADPVNYLQSFKSVVCLDPVLARFCREQVSAKVQLGLLVANLEGAVSRVRKCLHGFHSLSKLTLESSDLEHLNIDFNINDVMEDEVEDTDYMEQSDVEYFNKRSSDAITMRAYRSAGISLLRSTALKDISIRISFLEDGPRIREMIKNNRLLSQIELSIDTKDDPCQVFESFKALVANHPSLVSFRLCKDWGENDKSSFIWHDVSDRTKMTLSIQSYSKDKIGPLIQKFGSCLLQLYIHGINEQDSAILEKVMGSRRGLKLVSITLVDACLLGESAMDALAKVVTRLNLERLSIMGMVTARKAGQLADFMKVVAAKITEIDLFGEHAKGIMIELGKRLQYMSTMEQLVGLKVTGPFYAATEDLTWMRTLFKKEIPLSTFELQKVNLSHQGWMTLAKEIDFERLKYFRISPEVSLKPEAIATFTSNVPVNSELENFHLDTDGMKEVHCLSYKAALLPKLRKTAVVSIGRYF
ncbi:hypothetical protein EC957_005449 [Mortierella hygrophila]|uniref:Uncharacterized protein n=1 Tax=Mortierella hygrophila TaxID=979708 RepID=A0A9P6F0A9_9FUNG|nr:hypothetical protein EC957_005449 [Mortierella hygrophila]